MPIKMTWSYQGTARPASPMRATMQHFMPAFAQPQPLSRPERPKSVRLQPAQMDADALETAAVLYREALAQCREKLGDRHEDTLTSINNLAMLLLAQDELEEAGQLLCEALDASRETFGPMHQHTLVSMTNLGSLYKNAGELEEAEKLYREALDGARAAVPLCRRGNVHPMA